MTSPILIIAIGNESRGDDALAPLLLRKLDVWLATQADRERIELLEDFQLQIEHAADLAGRELVLFIDAGMDTLPPYSFYRARAGDGRTLFSHALAPEAVLATYAQVYREHPPPAFVLCLRGEQFELGSSLSPESGQRLELAAAFARELLGEANLPAWESRRRAACIGLQQAAERKL
jgi:hydrogenase maturation protease